MRLALFDQDHTPVSGDSDQLWCAQTRPPPHPGRGPGSAARPALVPPVDIVENDTAITLYADMPGFLRDRLGMRVDRASLVIEGSAVVQTPQGLEILHGEIRNPYFRRSFTLSRELDAAKISATLRDGVLRLVI